MKEVPTAAEAAALIHGEQAPDLAFLVIRRLPAAGAAEEPLKRQAALDEAMTDPSLKDLLAASFRIRIQPPPPAPKPGEGGTNGGEGGTAPAAPAEGGSPAPAPASKGTADAIEALAAPSLLVFRRRGVAVGTFDGNAPKAEEVKAAAVKWLLEKLAPPAPAEKPAEKKPEEAPPAPPPPADGGK